MPQFAWYGRDEKQNARSGVIESGTRLQAADALGGQGILPIVIELHVPPSDVNETLARWMNRDKVGETELLLFTRQLHTLLRAGVPIMRALQGLRESSTHQGLAKLLGRLRQGLDAGLELSRAMAREPQVFDEFFISMVRVGESTGQLDLIFDNLHHHLDFQRYMREQITSALRYPKFVIGAMVIAMAIINIFVIPAFAKVFENLKTELPLMTRILLGTSRFVVEWWWAIVIVAAVAALVTRAVIATPAGRLAWDRWKLHIPVAGKILNKGALSRACRSLSMVLKAGVPVLDGLALAATVTENAHMERAILGMRQGVERGDSVLTACRKAGIFTPIVLQMVMVGEESGTLDEMLDEIGGMYQREVEYELKTMSQQIEPILIFFLGAMVLVLALGVFMPMWDLGKAALK